MSLFWREILVQPSAHTRGGPDKIKLKQLGENTTAPLCAPFCDQVLEGLMLGSLGNKLHLHVVACPARSSTQK